MKRGGSRWGIIWRFSVAVLLLAWIFHSIFVFEGQRSWEAEGGHWEALSSGKQWRLAWTRGPAELWSTISLVRMGPLGLSLVFMGMTIALGVARWHRVLRRQGFELGLGRTIEISLVAHFFNSFLLGSTGGDLLKAYYAARQTHHKKAEAVTTVFVDRLLGLFAMLLFACLMMIPNRRLLMSHDGLAALAWLIVLMMLGCGAVVSLSLWGGISNRIPWIRQSLRRLPKSELFERAIESCRELGRDRKFLAELLGISMVLSLFCVLQIWVLAAGLGARVDLMKLLVIVPVVVCISALPISLSGLGIRENLYVVMLTVPEIGVPATHALSISLLAFAGSLVWSVIGGVVYLLRKDRDAFPEMKDAETGVEDS